MIYFAIFAAILGVCTVWMMRDEIVTGYARSGDYCFVSPVLCAVGSMLYWAASLLPMAMGLASFIIVPVKLALIVGFILFFWGAIITAGALILKLLNKPS
jgi:hypothetical protein